MEATVSTCTPTEKKIAVVTGSNKGIGFEICRQLASNGVRVILTARDEKRGFEAAEKLRECDGLSHHDLIFHPLVITDRSSIASLASFVDTHFGKLDILVNNAAINGVTVDMEVLKALKPSEDENQDPADVPDWLKRSLREPYEMAEECLKTNYYGTKNVVEAFLPLLLKSHSGRIVNVSSTLGQIRFIRNDRIKRLLLDVDGLTEEKLDEVLNRFLKDFEEDMLEVNGWPTGSAAYKVSKILLNAYTRILAKKYPTLCINCVSPGFTKTDFTFNCGILTAEEAARGPAMLGLLPDGSPTGLFFDKTELSTF